MLYLELLTVRCEEPRKALLMTYKNPGTKKDTFYKMQGKQPNHNLYRGLERDKINTTSVNTVSITA